MLLLLSFKKSTCVAFLRWRIEALFVAERKDKQACVRACNSCNYMLWKFQNQPFK